MSDSTDRTVCIGYGCQTKGVLYNHQYMNSSKSKMLKAKCLEQHALFIKWDERKNYSMFHRSHYDWWAFPIDQLSSHGDKFKVGPIEKDALIHDKEFVNALRGNAVLVCRSWGYDLESGKPVNVKTADQKWQQWPIRLYKLTNSLELFQQEDLFIRAVQFGNILIGQGHKFSYNRKRLDEYFIAKAKEEKQEKQKFEEMHQQVKKQKEMETEKKEIEVKPQKVQVEQKETTVETVNQHKQQKKKPSTKATL